MDAFTVLAEPTRRSIVGMVARRGALTAMQIGERFTSSPPAISQHLKVLRDADVLRVERRGRQRVYRLNPAGMDEVDRWVRQTKELWDGRLDRLDKLLSPKNDRLKTYRKSKNKNHGTNKRSDI